MHILNYYTNYKHNYCTQFYYKKTLPISDAQSGLIKKKKNLYTTSHNTCESYEHLSNLTIKLCSICYNFGIHKLSHTNQMRIQTSIILTHFMEAVKNTSLIHLVWIKARHFYDTISLLFYQKKRRTYVAVTLSYLRLQPKIHPYRRFSSRSS